MAAEDQETDEPEHAELREQVREANEQSEANALMKGGGE